MRSEPCCGYKTLASALSGAFSFPPFRELTPTYYFWQYLMSYHQGIMKLLGQDLPQRPTVVQRAEELPFWEFDYDLCQREGLSIIGDPDHVIRELQKQEEVLGCGIVMGLFQFGSMPHDLAMKNIRLFAKTVLPEVQKN